jgi:uncharacterized protein (DUF488 family)
MVKGEQDQKLIEVFTVGHSTRSGEEFVKILNSCDIDSLVDVRSFPGSRRCPQFNKDALSEFLAAHKIEYRHFPSLGGRRKTRADSKNIAWRNASFRAYADHMESAEFKQGIKELLELATEKRIAIMCAEAVWWRCHRSVIADYLKSIGVVVKHIIGVNTIEIHPYTSAARIVEGKLSYEGLLNEEQS